MSTNDDSRANGRRKGYRGYRPAPPGSVGNPVGKLGGEPVDGIDYMSDDLWELRIANAMHMQWTSEGDVRAHAAAEQVEAAMREAERYDDRSRLLLNDVEVREKLRDTLNAMRALDPSSVEFFAPEIPMALTDDGDPPVTATPPRFDRDARGSWRGLFGLMAGKPRRVHVFRGGYTVERWIQGEQRRRWSCQWQAADCADYAHKFLTFASGQYVVAVPTCFACEQWLRPAKAGPVARLNS